ncbi:MAG: Lrp/AsnC family transcriptional regulator [archaeon]
MLTINKKDKQILFALESDARQSLKSVAKRARLSTETTFHRIKNLEKRGIIKGYLAEIDTYKAGYFFVPILLQFQNTTPEIETELYSQLQKIRHLAWLTTCEGRWHANLTLFARNNTDIERCSEQLLDICGSCLAEKQLFTTTYISYFKRNFGLDETRIRTISTGTEDVRALEMTEQELLHILGADARRPSLHIAKDIGVSSKTIAAHIKKLQKEGILQGSHLFFNFAAFDHKYYKTWFRCRRLDARTWRSMLTFLQTLEGIRWATRLIGIYDFSLEFEIEDIAVLRKHIASLKGAFPDIISSHETLLILDELVLNYFPKH